MYNYKILFVDFCFHDGINSTCRLGTKHFDTLSAILKTSLGVRLLLCDNEGNVLMKARLNKVIKKNFKDLSIIDVGSNHISPKNWNVLAGAMYEAYGDRFNTDSEVTVIFFDSLEKYCG